MPVETVGVIEQIEFRLDIWKLNVLSRQNLLNALLIDPDRRRFKARIHVGDDL